MSTYQEGELIEACIDGTWRDAWYRGYDCVSDRHHVYLGCGYHAACTATMIRSLGTLGGALACLIVFGAMEIARQL